MSRFLEKMFARPERNVGAGDFATRVVASLLLAALVVIMLPQMRVAYSLIKISLLFAAELGLVSLMLGLFLRAKTFFAGLQLMVTPLVMLWLARHNHFHSAMAFGLFFLWIGIANLVTRRSRLNHVLNLDSLTEAIAQLPPDDDKPAAPSTGARS
ncbi:MAG: hypothetical protein IPJ65_24780 [Archangiaceae bacterium]|nr:hypothetical protein [Archangiaceae bacterium]